MADAGEVERTHIARTVRCLDIVVPLGLVVIGGMVVTSGASSFRLWIALAALAVMCIAYATIGRRLIDAGRPSWYFHLTLILAMGVGIAASSNVAIAQAVSMPLIWLTAKSTKQSVLTSAVAMLAGAIGFAIGLPPSALPLALLAQLAGAGFGIGLGLWLSAVDRERVNRGQLIAELERSRAIAAHESAERAALSERNRIAQDLHDTIAQDLAGITLMAQRGSRANDPELLKRIEQLASESLGELRSLASATAPLSLDGGLHAALTRLGERLSRDAAMQVAVEASDAPLPKPIEVTILRVAQEALANVRKHAKADHARVQLEVADGRATLTITDDGVGFDSATTPTGLGLDGFVERAVANGGEVDVRSDDSGTSVTFSVPLTLVRGDA